MTKTLADMTLEEREQCRGMWCEVGGDDALFILVGKTDYGTLVINTSGRAIHVMDAEDIKLRPDLPRAWMPDGTPPDGGWEEDCQLADVYQRWVGQWEPKP